MDYITDVNDLSDEELIEVMNDLCNVLGVDRNELFRDFFIKFMDFYAKSSCDSLKEINALMNIETLGTPESKHKQRRHDLSKMNEDYNDATSYI